MTPHVREAPARRSFERRCAERGLRVGGKRRLILRVLDGLPGHPDAEEVYRRAQRLDPRLSLATVYRALNALTRAGLLTRRVFTDGRARYEDAAHAPHDHLVDRDTGAVVELRDARLAALLHAVAARMGYRLVGYRMEMTGRKDAGGARGGGPACVSGEERIAPAPTRTA